ncbi:MAG: RNA polymerase sigma factor [Sedimentisphaerales bacterium]|nr:RNA polymerase sigma factor [Sedimentisphaerales bacterium]
MSKEDNLKNPEIKKLIGQSLAGNRRAFDQIVQQYQKKAMRLAVKIIGNAEGAAEAVQQGFVTAYLKIGKLKDINRFETWLLRIIANKAIDQLRIAGKQQTLLKNYRLRPAKKVNSPQQNQIGKELQTAIEAAMEKITKKEAMAISLFGLQGLSQNQVAQIMKCSAETVRWHVHQARTKLKLLLKEYL